MRLSCTICYELFIQNDNIYAAPCGHMLHYNCWTGWLQRSQNCPDCRKSTRMQELVKLFFNISEGDDYGTLSNKYDALRCELSCKTKDWEAVVKKLKLQTEENSKLQEEVQRFKAENEKLKKSSVQGIPGFGPVKQGMNKSLLINKEETDRALARNKELALEIEKLKKQVAGLSKKTGKNVMKNCNRYSEAEIENMKECESLVKHLKFCLPEYQEMKKNDDFVKSLKVYTDQVESVSEMEVGSCIDLFRDVKRFLDQKTKREEELSQCPRGCVLELSGIPKNSELTWHDVRDIVERFQVCVAFVTFNPGEKVAFVRLEEAFDIMKGHYVRAPAIKLAQRLSGKVVMHEGIALKPRALQGQEEVDFLRKSLESRDDRNRERFRRRRGYEEDDGGETFLDICMHKVGELVM